MMLVEAQSPTYPPSRRQIAAAEARASSASSSIIGHVATPMAASDSSSGMNCAYKLCEAPDSVEVTEELVRAIEQMNNPSR